MPKKCCNTTSNQSLSLDGTVLTLSDGNSVTLPTPQLEVTRETLIVGFASGYQTTNTTNIARNATITRNGTGVYTVTFASPHPNGANYEILFGGHEDTNRDATKVWAREGSLTPTGFVLEVTVDDNGATADTRVDEPFSFEVLYEKEVITGVVSPDSSINIVFV